MTYRFQTSEMVCSRMIEIDIDEEKDVIRRVEFVGGCPGNLAGIGRLAAGMKPAELIERLQGIRCGGKPTSCPDQLATALREITKRRQA
ncbi:TIGR03905 family TSCPD domain-containing protein [uncultured Victivallis sp.]|uniref:TIGR03905 family TSCPD domain-containing protein n=1 Tax=uncultured Victivallis sp. TaxID=354118 RepID=UPI0025E4AAA7|nr:TIGR03905 family TSCPD domain-containing protein [uncultured Victivallis sp.]